MFFVETELVAAAHVCWSAGGCVLWWRLWHRLPICSVLSSEQFGVKQVVRGTDHAKCSCPGLILRRRTWWAKPARMRRHFFLVSVVECQTGCFLQIFFFGATCFTSQFMPMSEQKRRMPKSCTMTRPAAKADMLWNSLFDSMIESRKQPVLSLCNCVF